MCFSSRTDSAVKKRWNSTISRRVELGLFQDNADSVSVDIQQFVEGEVQLNNNHYCLACFSPYFRLIMSSNTRLLSNHFFCHS